MSENESTADCEGGADTEADEDVDDENVTRQDCVKTPLIDALTQVVVVTVGCTVIDGLIEMSEVALSEIETAGVTLGAIDIDDSRVLLGDTEADKDSRLDGDIALGVDSTVTVFDADAHGDTRGVPVAKAVALADGVRSDEGVFKTDCETVSVALVEPVRDALARDVFVGTDVSDRAYEFDGDTVAENDWPDFEARGLSDEFGDFESPDVTVGVNDGVDEELAHFDTGALAVAVTEFDKRMLVVPLRVDTTVVDMLWDTDVEKRALLEAAGVNETDGEPEADDDTVGVVFTEFDDSGDSDAALLRVEHGDDVSDLHAVGVESDDFDKPGLEERAGDEDAHADG